MRGLLIAGTHSGCGKTTITLGLLTLLRKRGLKVQPFKAGPDFIDTGLHRLSAGAVSRNLDLWMCGSDYVRACYQRHSQKADIAIVEGVMGLYDGDNSTYRLATVLNLPIVLVIDASAMAESVGAIVKGFLSYDSHGLIKAVILNRVGSKRHAERLMRAIKGVEVIGIVPKDTEYCLPSRHLGLVVAEEEPITVEGLDKLSEAIERHLSIDGLFAIARQSGSLGVFTERPVRLQGDFKVAVAYDSAFCFYYEDNLDLLRDVGAEVVRFSPLRDSSLPEAELIYIGGGYPELHAYRLSENKAMLEAIRQWCQSSMPLYAECGGMMYLSKGIYDLQGRYFPMVGVFDFETKMNNRLYRLGYREVSLKRDCLIGKKQDSFRGHEFHYSEVIDGGHEDHLYDSTDSDGNVVDAKGYVFKNTLSSYVHLHFGSNSSIVTAIADATRTRHLRSG